MENNMKKFYITIEETVCETFEVVAEDENQAREIAATKYESGEFVLEPGELQSSKMKVSNESYETLIDWEEI